MESTLNNCIRAGYEGRSIHLLFH